MKTNGIRSIMLPFLSLIALGAMACGGDSDDVALESVSTVAPTAPAADAATPRVISMPTSPTSQAGSTPTPAPTKAAVPATSGRSEDDELAPEFRSITSWINSEAFTIESQRGKVVLIDFWTYTCVNCIRTLPYIKEWHEKYADSGLVIVGVHTPEFDFEKDRENVHDAVAEFEIKYAVAQDNDFGTWRNFENRYWPAKYLIDKDGYIRYEHFGEGAYDETEEMIRHLLEETGADLSQISAVTAPAPRHDSGALVADSTGGLTRELYAGYERNYGALQTRTSPPYILHPEYYQAPDAEVLYSDTGDHQNQFLYLHGLWRNEAETPGSRQENGGFRGLRGPQVLRYQCERSDGSRGLGVLHCAHHNRRWPPDDGTGGRRCHV